MGNLDQIRLLLKAYSTEEFQNAFGDEEKIYDGPADVERDIKALMSLPEDKMPPHLARFIETAKLAMQFAYSAVAADTHEDCLYGACEERAFNDFKELQSAVLADGKVDEMERSFLMYTLRRLAWEVSPMSASGLLSALLDGHRLPEDGMNTGLRNEPEMCKPANGFVKLSWDDERVKKRDIRKTCILFALSGTPFWELPELYKDRPADQHLGIPDDYLFTHLREHFRPVDLEKEPAMPGDIVAYFSSDNMDPNRFQFNIKHMSVVSEVGENGRPSRAFGKNGYGGVFEHPIDRVSLSYGFRWVVFRDKSLDF